MSISKQRINHDSSVTSLQAIFFLLTSNQLLAVRVRHIIKISCLLFLPRSTSLNPSLLQWERPYGCRGSPDKQTTAIPWNTAKYLQPHWTHTDTHTHTKDSSRFLCLRDTHARRLWQCSGCFGLWRWHHSNNSITSTPGV